LDKLKTFATSYDNKMKRRIKILNESKWAVEIAHIMEEKSGPFTKQYLAQELEKKFIFRPKAAILEVSCVLQSDVYLEKPRFHRVEGGWDLIERSSFQPIHGDLDGTYN
jgi:hypothetical protein